MIEFHVAYQSEQAVELVNEVMRSGQISGGGRYTERCHEWARNIYSGSRCLLTHSGSGALDLCAILSGVGPGDEVILPSYTHPSTAIPFLRQGATLRMVDTLSNYPVVDPDSVERAINAYTRAIVVMHYGGVPCDMKRLRALADKNDCLLIEDAAHAIGASHEGIPLGHWGDLSALSFHQTKNIGCGDGGMVLVNHPAEYPQASIVWEKGTNRSDFIRGEAERYEWMGLGSCYYPSELTAAYLYGQLGHIEEVNEKKKELWQRYHNTLSKHNLGDHMFLPQHEFIYDSNHHTYLVCFDSESRRSSCIHHLQQHQIDARTHYVPLHHSAYYRFTTDDIPELPNTDGWYNGLLRLPLHQDMTLQDVDRVCQSLMNFLSK